MTIKLSGTVLLATTALALGGVNFAYALPASLQDTPTQAGGKGGERPQGAGQSPDT